MKADNNSFSTTQIQSMIEAYFDGSISQEDITRLLEIASRYERSGLWPDDKNLTTDLKSILALENYSKIYLTSLEIKTPKDLEERLDSHISRLASISKLKLWKRIKIGSAAACATLLLSVGVNYYTRTETVNHPNMPEMIYIAKPTPDEPAAPHSMVAAVATATSQEFIVVNSSHTQRNIETRPKQSTKRTENTKNFDIPELSVADVRSKIKIPEILPTLDEIIPMVAEATVNPTQLVVQPFSTLSQAFDNVFESISTVNAAILDSNKTFVSASEGIARISTASLREI